MILARLRRTNRYCIDCGSRLVYYALLSNPKAPNEFRSLVYTCPDCTKYNKRPKMISVKRVKVDDPLKVVRKYVSKVQKQ